MPRNAVFLPETLPHALSKETPGEEEEEATQEHPTCPLDEHLQAVNLCRQEISQRAEGSIPQRSGDQLIYQEAQVPHPGHAGTQRDKRTELPCQVRNEDRLPSMSCDQHARQAQPPGQPNAATQSARAPSTGNAGQDEPSEQVVDVIATDRSKRGKEDYPA